MTQLFTEQLPAFVVALDRLTNASAEQQAVRSAELEQVVGRVHAQATSALGESTSTALLGMLRASQAVVGADEASDADLYLRKVDAFNKALEELGLGYYVDADVRLQAKGLRVYLASFAVEHVRWYRAASSRVRVLHLARKDSLNFVHGVLGFTRPNIRDALVLLDRVDAWAIDALLPALDREGRYQLARPKSRVREPDGVARLELRVAQEVSRELRARAVRCSALEDTGSLFRRRNDVFAALTDRVLREGGSAAADRGQRHACKW